MPTHRTVALGNGQTMLGGLDYATSEACEWFLHGAADRSDLTPSDDMRTAWSAWVAQCRTLWDDLGPAATCGMRPDMPEGFPVDAMHTAQGAGVSVDDGDREYSEGSEDALKALGAALRWPALGARPALYAAFRDFEEATDACVPRTYNVLSIDAWNGPEGWQWNAWYKVGEIPEEATSSPRKMFAALRAIGVLGPQSAGRVRMEDDGLNFVVYARGSSRPLYAVEHGR